MLLLGRFLEHLQERCDLGLGIEMRAGTAVAEMSETTEPTVLNSSYLESAPAHGMPLIARRAMMNRR